MFFVCLRFFHGKINRSTLFLMGALAIVAMVPATSWAQRTRASTDEPENRAAFSDFKGVHLGMTTDEARKKLGNPRDKGDEQDFYVFNDTQAVQIFYDKAHVVSAISIDFMDGATGIPTARDVLGTDAEAKADGSQYKLLRYPKAGYWVSYSRTAGSTPTTTVTIQKIDH
jgi:hypothetical protein